MDLFIDGHQYRKITLAQQDATQAKRKAELVEQQVDRVEQRVDRLALACQALWELLREKTGLTQQEVFAKMTEIDLRDGHKDGRMNGEVMRCVSCNRTIHSQNRICIYCGTPVPRTNIV